MTVNEAIRELEAIRRNFGGDVVLLMTDGLEVTAIEESRDGGCAYVRDLKDAEEAAEIEVNDRLEQSAFERAEEEGYEPCDQCDGRGVGDDFCERCAHDLNRRFAGGVVYQLGLRFVPVAGGLLRLEPFPEGKARIAD